jgi:hypothetical protein
MEMQPIKLDRVTVGTIILTLKNQRNKAIDEYQALRLEESRYLFVADYKRVADTATQTYVEFIEAVEQAEQAEEGETDTRTLTSHEDRFIRQGIAILKSNIEKELQLIKQNGGTTQRHQDAKYDVETLEGNLARLNMNSIPNEHIAEYSVGHFVTNDMKEKI